MKKVLKLSEWKRQLDLAIARKLFDEAHQADKWIDIADKFGVTVMAVWNRRKRGEIYFKKIFAEEMQK